MMFLTKMTAASLACLLAIWMTPAIVQASEPDEAREIEIQRRHEQLDRLHAMERELDRNDELSEIQHERLEKTRHQIHRIHEELRELNGIHHGGHDAPHNEVRERLEHMHIAIEHLHRAGLPDLAEHVAQRAEATERELHQREQQHAHAEAHPNPKHELPIQELLEQFHQLRREMERLRAEVNGLKHRPPR